jgi:hypothetical protein
MNPLNYMRLHDHSSENPRQPWTNASNGKIRISLLLNAQKIRGFVRNEGLVYKISYLIRQSLRRPAMHFCYVPYVFMCLNTPPFLWHLVAFRSHIKRHPPLPLFDTNIFYGCPEKLHTFLYLISA